MTLDPMGMIGMADPIGILDPIGMKGVVVPIWRIFMDVGFDGDDMDVGSDRDDRDGGSNRDSWIFYPMDPIIDMIWILICSRVPGRCQG